MKLPFKILKCKAKGCNEKAEYSVARLSGWFCEEHYKLFCRDVQRLEDYITDLDKGVRPLYPQEEGAE